MSLIQVDDDAWIDPVRNPIGAVKHWPPRKDYGDELSKDNTVIIHSDGKITISYWPFDRIKRALGLIETKFIHEIWENGHP